MMVEITIIPFFLINYPVINQITSIAIQL